MSYGMLDGLESMFKLMFGLLVVFVPLGLWKAIELLCWAWRHIHWMP